MSIIAVGLGHLVVIGHRHLHLGISGLRQEREEHDEVLVPCNGLGDISRAAFLEVGIRNRQLGFSQIFAVRVGINQGLQPQPPGLMLAMFNIVHGLVVQLLVRFDGIGRVRGLVHFFLFVKNNLR